VRKKQENQIIREADTIILNTEYWIVDRGAKPIELLMDMGTIQSSQARYGAETTTFALTQAAFSAATYLAFAWKQAKNSMKKANPVKLCIA
jgi:hypothetical protein